MKKIEAVVYGTIGLAGLLVFYYLMQALVFLACILGIGVFVVWVVYKLVIRPVWNLLNTTEQEYKDSKKQPKWIYSPVEGME